MSSLTAPGSGSVEPEAHDGPVQTTHADTYHDQALTDSVQAALADYLAERRAGLAEVGPTFDTAAAALADFVLSGGKRLRPTFAWWAWRGVGGAGDGPTAAAALRTVSALELLQACALVHDDLMDDSAVRRGAPTVHVAFADTHRRYAWRGTAERFGMAAAVLIGDIALAWADDMFNDNALAAVSARELTAAREPWRAMRAQMLAGQYLDMASQAGGDETAATALTVARFKTAAYTVERPLHIGAALAGADGHTIAALRAFGTDLGVAFQLRDDLLGMYGDTEVTGKPAGDDLREGKRTLLMALGLRGADEAGRDRDAALLRAAVGDQALAGDTLDTVRSLLVELGAVDDVERRISALTASALAALSTADLADTAARRLTDLAVAATSRDR